jgi:RNA polymerase sigma factor for flagellar operon FliA
MHLPLARKMATQRFLALSGGDVDLADVRQQAFAGLLEAIDRFDPELGASFRSFAAKRISGSIIDGLSKMTEVQEQISFRRRARRERARSLAAERAQAGEAADPLQQLADVAVGLALGFMLEGTGLYAVGEDGPVQSSAYDSFAWNEVVNRALAEVAGLAERERTIIRRHYLDGLSFEQIGTLLGVSKGRISQLHRSAMTTLRKRLRSNQAFHLTR